MENTLKGSVCRIANFDHVEFNVRHLPFDQWSNGDYVVGEITTRPAHDARIEAPSGRNIEPLEGERVIGALGRRRATRGIVGSWENIDNPDGTMHVIGGGGIIGQVRSISPYLHDPIALDYLGHVHINGTPKNMSDYVELDGNKSFDTPVVLVLGTSMSSGKTMSAKVVVRTLVEMGMDPVACKLSGSGRYHDIMTMKDAGARQVFDFVDAGLPTTVIQPERYQHLITDLLSHLESTSPEVLVVEIGASPLEPYNGSIAIEQLKSNVKYTILTASDPYAVVGLNDAFDTDIDLVSGIATNTEAGIELIDELSGLPAINLQDESAKETLARDLKSNLN